MIPHTESTRRRAWIALSIACAAFAGLAQLRHDAALKHRYGADAPKQTILVAARDLAVSTFLQPDDLKEVAMPEQWVHPLVVVADEIEDLQGLPLLQPLVAGQPVLWSDVETELARGLLSSAVQGGLRAVSVPVRMVDALGGLLRPGDSVDLLATFDKPKVGQVTTTLLQDVLVLATGRAIHPGDVDEKFRNISVQVTPDEAELLFFARNRATLGLALRNPADRDAVAELPEVTFSDLTGTKTVRREPRPTIVRAPRGAR